MVKTSPFKAGDVGLIPDQEAKIPHASWPKKKKRNIKHKKYCNTFNKDFKNGPHQKKKRHNASLLLGTRPICVYIYCWYRSTGV